jgi:hypothetical protein
MLHLFCRVRVIGQPEGTLKQCSGNRTVGPGRRIGDPEVEPVLGECIIANALIESRSVSRQAFTDPAKKVLRGDPEWLDGGWGALELSLVLLPILFVALLVLRRHFTGRSNGFLWQK